MEEIQKIIEQLEARDYYFSWYGKGELRRGVAEEALRQGKTEAFKRSCASMAEEIEFTRRAPLDLYPNLDREILSQVMRKIHSVEWNSLEESLEVSRWERNFYRSLIATYVHEKEIEMEDWERDLHDLSPVACEKDRKAKFLKYPNISKLFVIGSHLEEEMKAWKIKKITMENMMVSHSDMEIMRQWEVEELFLDDVIVEDWNLFWTGVPSLRKLTIADTSKFTLPSIRLRSLFLSNVKMSEDNCFQMGEQKDLVTLRLMLSTLPDSIWEVINCPHLREFSFFGSKPRWFVEQMMEFLSRHPKLRALNIPREYENEEECSALIPILCQLKELEILDIDRCLMTDDDILLLTQNLRNLKNLSVCECDLGDASILHLKGLSFLRRLDIKGNNITKIGAFHLVGSGISANLKGNQVEKGFLRKHNMY